MIVVGVKVFLVIFYVISRIKFVGTSHGAFCITIDGRSAGSHNFCSRCRQNNSGGLGIYFTPTIYSLILGGKNIMEDDEDIGVSVTTITIDGVTLEGWFHIALKMPTKRLVYAFVMQVEDDVTNRAAGELTTDLLSACENRDLTNVPTAAQILPCHGTPKTAVTVPNAFVYSREADVLDGTIRSKKPPSEFHVNWKIPPSYACASARTFHIRVRFNSLDGMKSIKNDGDQCLVQGGMIPPCVVPIAHRIQKIKIHLPPLSEHGEFSYAHPLPPFYGKVECHNVMKMGPPKSGTEEVCEPYLTNPTIPNTTNDWQAGSSCFQGSDIFPPGEPPLILDSLGNAVKTSEAQPLRPLYLGRCTEANAGQAGANYSLDCVGPSDPEDVTFLKTLPTMTDYIEGIRYDLCKCESVGLTAGLTDDGGSLPLSAGSGPDIVPPPPLPPDYPDLSVIVSGSVNTLGVSDNNSNSTTVETPFQKIQRKVNAMHFLHALFSSIAFIFFIPVSMFSARYMKETFYGDTTVIDFWFKLHLAGTAGTFICFTIAQFVLLAGSYWSGILEPLHSLTSERHGLIGWVVIGLYVFLVVTGGLRPYNPNSAFSLKLAIYFHAFVGFAFYCLGLYAMIVHLAGNFDGLIVIVLWIAVDVLFHIIMTGLAIHSNKQLGLGRSWFPVMELLFNKRNGPGHTIRQKLFKLYIALSLIATFLICYYCIEVIYRKSEKDGLSFLDRKVIKNRLSDKVNMVYY